MNFDPIQIALDTFDKVVSACMAKSTSENPNNISFAVRTHIYRALFKECVTASALNFSQPITPSELIQVVTAALNSMGLY